MAFKDVQDLSADTTVSLGGVNRKTGKKNPTKVEGYYLGSREIADNKKKSGKSFMHIFQTAEGNIGVWGKTDLDRKMTPSLVGSMVKASFDKMVPTPNGEMYKYKVQFDPENTIEVETGTLNTGSSTFGDEDNLEDISNSQDTEDDENDEDEAQALALAAAERKAKVAALLSNKLKITKN